MTERVIVVDCETTGLDVERDYVCEVCVRAFDDEREPLVRRIKIPVPMPEVVFKIHGISDADLIDCPTFGMIADELAEFLEWGTVIAGYNPEFDLNILRTEFTRAGRVPTLTTTVVCAKRLWNIKEPPPKRSLIDAYKNFVNPAGFDGAHGALADVNATIRVLRAQRDTYNLTTTPWAEWDPDRNRWVGSSDHLVWQDSYQQKILVNFGKHKGKEFSELDYGYLRYLQEKDFPPHVKQLCAQLQLNNKQKIPNPQQSIALWAKENLR
jgi:DNA polymerase-3 subunit epsilon